MDWLTILPPVLAVIITIRFRQVVPALLAALVSSECIQASFDLLPALTNTFNRLIGVFASTSNTEILLFSLLMGALLALVRNSGGVNAFVDFLLARNIARTPRSTGLLTSGLGMVIFIESYLSVLTSGIFGQHLFDRYHMSRARLAYIIDSTCSPVSVLILLNSWGAYILGLLDGYGLENPLGVMLASIPLNAYAIITLVIVFTTGWSGRTLFALASHESDYPGMPTVKSPYPSSKAGFFLIPIGTLIASFIVLMVISGKGNLINGSGSKSILYGVMLAIMVAFYQQLRQKRKSIKSLLQESCGGMRELLPAVVIILLAFALGASMQTLGTGPFIAGLISRALPLWMIAPVVFIAAGIMSFTTGTSWGTFGILVPVAIPIALDSGLSPALLLSAVLGGGVFGDHCSPISDSTVLASLAAGCDHLEHVRTQLPYALLAGALSFPCLIFFSL